MFVSTKVAEPDAALTHPSGLPNAHNFSHFAPAFQRKEIVLAERALLRVLEFDLLLSTTVIFLDAYIHVHALALRCAGGGATAAAATLDGAGHAGAGGIVAAGGPSGKHYANFISDLLLADGDALGVAHSELAAAALVVACNAVGVPSWTPAIEHFTGMKRAALQPHVRLAARALRRAGRRRNGVAGEALSVWDYKHQAVSTAVGRWPDSKFLALEA